MKNQQSKSINEAIRQQQGMERSRRGSLISTPYYIQELETKIAVLDHKLNLVLKELSEINNENDDED